MIHVIADIELQPGRRDDFLGEFRKLVPLVLAEAGCIEYGPAIDVPTGLSAQQAIRKNSVTVVEKWQSVEHLKRHLDAPHMHDYRAVVREMVVSTRIFVLEPA